MAINPNTNFTAGQVLTADQQNRLPRGVVAFGAKTTTQSGISTETEIVASSSFTAIANRYYKITFSVPRIFKTTTGNLTYRVRLTNTSGTQIQALNQNVTGGTLTNETCIVVTTFSAGSTVVIGSLASDAGSAASEPGATQPAQIIVEDIGPS
jgi:hypothetical protein